MEYMILKTHTSLFNVYIIKEKNVEGMNNHMLRLVIKKMIYYIFSLIIKPAIYFFMRLNNLN